MRGRCAIRVLLLPLAAFFLLVLEAGAPHPAAGVGFTVDGVTDAADANPGDGVCATEAGECTLRAAVQETNALPGPDEITLPAGTYELAIPGRAEDAATTGDLDITDDLTITGAGRDTTVIDGGQLDRIFHARLFFHNQLQVNLSDLTVRNGKAELVPTIERGEGGGLFLGGGVSADLTDVAVMGNSSTEPGGGIWIGLAFASFPPSSVDLTRAEISGNSSGLNNGGGIFSWGTVTLTDSLVSSNSGGRGGGIDNGGSLTVIRSRIASNETGGISNSGTASFTMTDSQVVGNHSRTSGGGLSAAGAVVVANSTISDNTADQEGGGLFVADGSIVLIGVTISGNTAGTDGAGVYVWTLDGPGLELTNGTISGNVAGRDGGGIFVLVGTVGLTNTTVASNAAASGAVAYSDAPVTREVRAINTMVSNNTPSNCTDPITSLGNNLEDADTCGLDGEGDILSLDPMLGPLGDYGGPTLTHALLEGSPAIDAGAADGCPGRDQRGAPRPFDGDGVSGAACDIGAYEFLAPAPPPPPHVFGDVNCGGTVDSVDALSVLRHVAGFPPLAACLDVADVNCNGGIDAVDALLILRYVAALPAEPPPGCPAIGTPGPAPATARHSENRRLLKKQSLN